MRNFETLILLMIATVSVSLCTSCGGDCRDTECDVRIAWDYDTLQEMTDVWVADKDFNETDLHYPRIKRLSDGSLMMTFSNHHYGWNVYVRRSEDNGRTWSDARMVREQYPAVSSVGNDTVVFVNPDFIELQDGRILLAYQWRYKSGYGDIPHTNENCGIEIMFSDDFGKTFSEPREMFRARCWEPALLQLPSGEIQMFVTSSQDVVDGVSYPRTIVLRSFDGGETWQGKRCATIYDVEPISRSIDDRFAYDGMPTGVWLDDDNGIAVPLESWHGRLVVDQSPIVVKTTVEKNWRTDYDKILEQGGPDYPAKKQVNKDLWAYGPYSTKLPTGNMVILCNGTYKGVEGIWTLIGDRKADNFRYATSPFGGHWGSIDYIGDNRVIATSTFNYKDASGRNRAKVMSMQGRLNYSKNVAKGDVVMPKIADFDRANNDYWFIGKVAPSSVFTDFGYTDDAFIIATYLFDKNIAAFTVENSDASVVLFSRKTAQGWNNYKIAVNALGKYTVYEEEGYSWHLVGSGTTEDVEVDGTINDPSDEDLGFAARVEVDWNSLGGKPKAGECCKAQLRHCYKVKATEKPLSKIEYADGESSDYPQEWLSVRFE